MASQDAIAERVKLFTREPVSCIDFNQIRFSETYLAQTGASPLKQIRRPSQPKPPERPIEPDVDAQVSRDQAVRFLPLSEPMFLILLALTKEDLHGYGILQAIKTNSAGKKSLRTGTLYNALGRLERQCLLEEQTAAPPASPTRGSSPRRDNRGRTYGITELGISVLEAESHRLQGLVEMANAFAAGQAR